jgi:hypothetical protein
MSGEKDAIVNLHQSEYNRMMNACRRVDNVESEVQSQLAQASGALRHELNCRLSALNRRHDNLERHLSSMSDEVQRVESDLNRQIWEQSRQFQQSISALGQEMASQRREYLHLIQQQGERFDRALQAQENKIQAIQNALAQKEMSEKQQASQWIQDTERYIAMIDREYRHEKFKPGALQQIQAEFALTQGNYNQGYYQAAIATAQASYLSASKLRLELERLELEWEACLEAAKQGATETLALCEAQQACRFTFDTDAGAEEVAGEIDFWTQGALSRLRETVKAELVRLGAPETLTLEQLKQAIEQSEQWRNQCLDLTDKAKEALIASQLRNNIGQTIESALEQAGWELVDSTYHGRDFRHAVHIKLQNPQGDEIVAIISPEQAEGNVIRNKLNIAFFDRSTNDEAFRQARLKALTNALQEDGLDISQPQCKPGTENQPAQDAGKLNFQELRQAVTEG